MAVADALFDPMLDYGYVTSREFNASLKDRRWFMRHANGQRTHHLHVVVHDGDLWNKRLAFRDALRADSSLAARYAALKRERPPATGKIARPTPGPRGISYAPSPSTLYMQLKGCLYFRMTTDMNDVFKALADPCRRELLDRLHAENGQTLGELCERMAMTRQGVTKHLALLEAANLVVTVWRDKKKLHYLNPTPIQHIHERWIGKFERDRLEALETLKKALEGSQDG